MAEQTTSSILIDASPAEVMEVIAVQKGATDPERVIVISAHLDSRVSDVMNATADAPGANDDFGRERVTGDPAHRYAFRSTPLRNVELTGPWGHAGQFADLEEFVDHYSESDLKLFAYDFDQLEAPLRLTLVHNFQDVLATRDPLLDGVVFPREIIHQVTEYLLALTDPAALDLRAVIPDRVPSGLPIDR